RVVEKAEIRQATPRQLRHAVYEVSGQARQKTAAAIRVGRADSFRQPAPGARRSATRLPPIGAAYFASHTPAVSKAAAADWKMEVVKWDAAAAKIRAEREQ